MNTKRLALGTAALALLGLPVFAQKPVLRVDPSSPGQLGKPVKIIVEGIPGDTPVILFDFKLDPIWTKFGLFRVNPFASFVIVLPPIGADGTSTFSCNTPVCDFDLAKPIFYGQCITFSDRKPWVVRGISDLTITEMVTGADCPPCANDVTPDPKIWALETVTSAMFLPGCGDYYEWESPGTFIENSDGTCSLTGILRAKEDHLKRFRLDLRLTSRISLSFNAAQYPPSGCPNLSGVLNQVLSIFGGVLNPDEWRYYDGISGTLVGLGTNFGTSFAIEKRDLAAQLGFGAALRVMDYGLNARLRLRLTSGLFCPGNANADLHVLISKDCQ